MQYSVSHSYTLGICWRLSFDYREVACPEHILVETSFVWGVAWKSRGVGDPCWDDISHTTSQCFCSHMLSVVRKWKRRLLLAGTSGNVRQNTQQNKDTLGQDLTVSSPSSQNLTTFPCVTFYLFRETLFHIYCSLLPLGLNIKPISASRLCVGLQRFLTRA